jgi:protein-tyrosine phosphatase
MEDRFPALEGALNFRDLGGYRATDGRTVRWRRLYRSGTQHALTAGDLQVLADCGIRHAYDLRSSQERRDHPSRITALPGLEYAFREHEQLPGNFLELLKYSDGGAAYSRNMMLTLYAKIPFEFDSAIGSLLRRLVDGRLPLVFNCTAGKDRTGVTAALILAALGVPREDVLADYMLTEHCFERSCEMLMRGTGGGLFRGIPRQAWEPFMRAHPDYLLAMFAALDAAHGSIDRYLADRLGLHESTVEHLREKLLE